MSRLRCGGRYAGPRPSDGPCARSGNRRTRRTATRFVGKADLPRGAINNTSKRGSRINPERQYSAYQAVFVAKLSRPKENVFRNERCTREAAFGLSVRWSETVELRVFVSAAIGSLNKP